MSIQQNNLAKSIEEQIVYWQHNKCTKRELNTLISNLLCELSIYEDKIANLVIKI